MEAFLAVIVGASVGLGAIKAFDKLKRKGRQGSGGQLDTTGTAVQGNFSPDSGANDSLRAVREITDHNRLAALRGETSSVAHSKVETFEAGQSCSSALQAGSMLVAVSHHPCVTDCKGHPNRALAFLYGILNVDQHTSRPRDNIKVRVLQALSGIRSSNGRISQRFLCSLPEYGDQEVVALIHPHSHFIYTFVAEPDMYRQLGQSTFSQFEQQLAAARGLSPADISLLDWFHLGEAYRARYRG